jgi:hypothetical protein
MCGVCNLLVGGLPSGNYLEAEFQGRFHHANSGYAVCAALADGGFSGRAIAMLKGQRGASSRDRRCQWRVDEQRSVLLPDNEWRAVLQVSVDVHGASDGLFMLDEDAEPNGGRSSYQQG